MRISGFGRLEFISTVVDDDWTFFEEDCKEDVDELEGSCEAIELTE